MALVEINWSPSLKELRVFAILEMVFFAIVAGLVATRWSAPTVAWTICGVACAVGVIGLVVPRLMRPIYVVWVLAAFPIGWIVSHLSMAIVFYLLITPIGLLMRILGRDPLERGFDREAKTYWKPRRREKGTRRYFRQF